MTALVSYRLEGQIATLTMDDGKVNAMSLQMLAELHAALDRAVADRAVVVLTGRPGVFSAGFDLPVLAAGGPDAARMLRTGFELAERLLAMPTPVVIACSGHALAMGVFIVLSGDHRIAADGPFKIGANEVAIGLTMPHTAIEICRQRLAPAHFGRAVINAEIYAPEDAVAAGFVDRVVPAEELAKEAQTMAVKLSKLNMGAHAATKLLARSHALQAIHSAIDVDDATFRARS